MVVVMYFLRPVLLLSLIFVSGPYHLRFTFVPSSFQTIIIIYKKTAKYTFEM